MNQYVSDALLTWTHHIKMCAAILKPILTEPVIYSLVRFSAFIGDTEIAFIKNNANKIVRKADEIDRVNNRFVFDFAVFRKNAARV